MLGRYAIHDAIASGGMATVHLGRLAGAAGFARTVAIKRLHAQFATSPEFVDMFVDEARLAARIRHPNVVPTLDVVSTDNELFLVMEYVAGESLSRIARRARERNQRIPYRILTAVMSSTLHGLHAAHEAKDERGAPLGIVHRDVSPHNIHIGADGVPRVLDFGVAKAAGRLQDTRQGQLKGKLSYMPPEQLCGADVSRQSDIYSAGVVLWELIAGMKLFYGENEGAIVAAVLKGNVPPPSQCVTAGLDGPVSTGELSTRLDDCVLRALSTDPKMRYASAREFAIALENCIAPATTSQVAEWVDAMVGDILSERARRVAQIESAAADETESAAAGHATSMALRASAERPSSDGISAVRPSASRPNLNLPENTSSGAGAPSSRRAQPIARSSTSSSLGGTVMSTTPPAQRSRWPFVAAPLLLAAAGGGWWWNNQHQLQAERQHLASPPPIETPAPPAVVPPVLAQPDPPVAVPPVLTPVETPPVVTPPANTSKTTVKNANKCRPGMACWTTTHDKPPVAQNCNPPYRLDEKGVKRWKPECLQ